MMDIIFLSYDETNAERNWLALQERFPHARRVHGVKGVKAAHQQAAALSSGDFFFIVDGDNVIHEDFKFTLDFKPEKDTLYVWRCKNPVNDLVYGYGGVKLYNKFVLLELNKPTSIDVATTVAVKYKPVMVAASTTVFNATAFEAWRGAFREAVKLTMNVLQNRGDKASNERLQSWRTLGADRLNGNWCLKGANQGHAFALAHAQNPNELARINDFDWFRTQWNILNAPTSEALPFSPI